MSIQQRMEDAYRSNPQIGRKKLMREAGVSNGSAQRFLEKKKQPSPTASDPRFDFLETLTPAEIELLRKSVTATPTKHVQKPQEWAQSSFKFAAMADTHIGHKLASIDWWQKACDLIAREKCDFILHAGDITDGMSGRPGHFYELAQIGTGAQVKEAVARFQMAPCPVRAITGNHDAYAFKASGADPGEMIATALPSQFQYLGMDEADIEIQGVKIKIWHGGDGASYALSYRVQKFIEGLTGGEKPHIILSGHAHKAIFFECRNVMAFECGTLCGQTQWMRGKKLAAHTGFWIVEVWPAAGGGIERIKPEWVPLFT